MYMTTNVSMIIKCTHAQDEATCMPEGYKSYSAPECLWRKGKVMAANTQLDPTSALFETNMCHPVDTKDWDKSAPACLTKTDQQSCEGAQCTWSTMQEFLPTKA